MRVYIKERACFDFCIKSYYSVCLEYVRFCDGCLSANFLALPSRNSTSTPVGGYETKTFWFETQRFTTIKFQTLTRLTSKALINTSKFRKEYKAKFRK